jgi:hypothetical protein
MTGLAEVILTGGIPQQLAPAGTKLPTPRRRGLKQGGGWFLFGVIVVPILGILSNILRFSDDIVGLAAVVFFLGGIVRMLFALIFESGNPSDKTLEENVMQTAQKFLNKNPQANALPPQQSIPVDNYAPPRQSNWRDTNDLEPSSVIDNTTKLLNNQDR